MLGGRERLDEFADVRVLPFVDENAGRSMILVSMVELPSIVRWNLSDCWL